MEWHEGKVTVVLFIRQVLYNFIWSRLRSKCDDFLPVHFSEIISESYRILIMTRSNHSMF